MSIETAYHIPVLPDESIEGLNIKPDGVYVDATFGGGGHSRLILNHMGLKGRLYGFDQDAEAKINNIGGKRFTFVHSNFRYLSNCMRWYGVKKIDGLLADLGLSSYHIDNEARGFSFRFENSPLDMRMNHNSTKTAADILNQYTETALSDIFSLYGELHQARSIANTVVKRRKEQKFVTTGDFLEILKPFFSKEKEKKNLAQAFQALRIEVNDEMHALKDLLTQASELLNTSGRLVFITYHSLEDRSVKNFFRIGNIEGNSEQDFYGNKQTPFRLINNKVITPTEEEISSNPRSRSAKLRIVEKL
jgi:16S rRNA (cytosine1402-N4)-methyltransferase